VHQGGIIMMPDMQHGRTRGQLFDRIEELQAKLSRVEKVRDELATQCLNSHAVKMLDKALEKDDD